MPVFKAKLSVSVVTVSERTPAEKPTLHSGFPQRADDDVDDEMRSCLRYKLKSTIQSAPVYINGSAELTESAHSDDPIANCYIKFRGSSQYNA